MSKVLNYKDEDLSRLHEIQIKILIEIIRICDKYSIKWFSVGGTTLGAVRHKGFIPWDDDIDIGMLREDYEKFLEVAPKELKEGYTLAHYKIDKNVPHYFAKVRKDNTLFVEESSKKIKMHHGIFVDIFPHDKVPVDTGKSIKHRKKMLFFNRLFINKTTTIPFNKSSKLKLFINRCIKIIVKLFIGGLKKEYFYNKLDKFVKKYNSSDSNMISQSGYNQFAVKYEDILPTRAMKFENIEIQVPNNYDEILKQTYGNYMELPPIDKRVNHAPLILKFEEELE